MRRGNFRQELKTYIIALVTMLVLTAIFLNSFYWPYDELSKRKIVVWFIAFLAVTVVPILLVKISIFNSFIKKSIHSLVNGFQYIQENKIKIIIFLSIMLTGVFLSNLATQIVSVKLLKTEFNPKLFETFIALISIIVAMSFVWKVASERKECVFVIVALIMGIFSIGVTPNRVGVSWDDEVHYRKTLEISNVLNGITYLADERNIGEYADNIYACVGYDRESAVQYESELTVSYDEYKDWTERAFWEYGVWSVAYVPAAIGIMLARGLELSYIDVFNVGRLVNLLCYILLIYLAMKRLKHGKVIVATIGLIPTSVFMASNYSYDWWVTGFTILGFSYFFAELQEESTLSNRNMFIMLGAFMLGCMPKAIYFPILFPLLFMPKKKFENAKQRRLFYLLVIGVGLLLVASFMLPRLINGIGTGDSRGGTEVNSTEQIKFILANPLAYAKILLKFEIDYVALANSGATLQRFAYVGDGAFYSTVSLMLAVLAFLDRGENEKNYVLVRGASLIGCAVAIVLSTTALYISFTAVGLGTVAGMQGRYMIPTIFPALYALGFGGIKHKINKNAFVCVPMFMIALTFIANMFRFCVLPY